MRSRLLAVMAGVAIALLATGTALAWPAGSITVDTNGCDYTLNVNQDQPNVEIGWEIRVWAASPHEGALVASGSGMADANGHFSSGKLTAAPGHYNALVDYTFPVSIYAEVVDFTLTCEATAPTGSELPIKSTPTPAPTGAELPAVGTPPPGLTPPPTDTSGAVESRPAGGAPLLVLGITALIAGALTFARTQTVRSSARTRRDSDRSR